ncbi:MAG TPA: hypothetical protein VF170_15665, partial [Planctomycetaceae bacterium]
EVDMVLRRAAVGVYFALAPVLFLALHRFDSLGRLVATYPDDALLTVGVGRLLPVVLAALGLGLLLQNASDRPHD